jgi:phosphoribosylanthranilate isomerase
MFVKICGITNAGDARAAAERGADAVGFIFWPSSPRFVDPEVAQAIVAALPHSVAAVGVFVNQPAGHVNDVAARVGLRAVQLHGDESEAFAAGISRPVIKSIALNRGVTPDFERWPKSVTLLVDAHDPVRRGGTGTTVDWTAAADLAKHRRVILAGGLTPENVADAIARVRPYGIDVSSGVERAPGVKDHDRLAALFDALGMSTK